MTEPRGDGPEIYESRKLEAGSDAEPAEKARLDAHQSEKSDLASSDEGDASYEMTEDQRQALLGMSIMRAEMGDYSEPPDYDVRERIQQLNSELEAEADPGERKPRVNFKEELVDLVAPPPEYPTEDEENGSVGQPSPRTDNAAPEVAEEKEEIAEEKAEEEKEGKDEELPEEKDFHESKPANVERGPPSPEPESVGSETADEISGSRRSPSPASSATNEETTKEKVLVERGGEYFLENEDAEASVEAETEDVYEEKEGDVGDAARSHSATSTSSSESEDDFERRQPRSLRPISAPTRQPQENTNLHQRPHSAVLDDDGPAANYNSPYALTADEKSRRQRRLEDKKRRLREREDRKKDEEKKKKEAAEAAFAAWLRNKREEAKEQHQRQRTKDDDTKDNDVDSSGDENFKAWLERKREQMRREKQLECRERDEFHKGVCVRSREDCQRAFKEWLRRKNREAAEERTLERQRARVTRLALRRSRKSQALARAIQQANAFRYVDYYGYRH